MPAANIPAQKMATPKMPAIRHPAQLLLMLLAGLVLCHYYAQGGPYWPLGLVFLVPWLRLLDRCHTLGASLLAAWAISLMYTLGGFAWFGLAIGHYTGMGSASGMLLLLAGALLFQPQIVCLVMVRHLARRRYGPLCGALAGAAAWVAAEWYWPKLLGDTLGHGLYPATLLRQGADLVGVAGLTLLLLLANEACAAALARYARGLRAAVLPLLPMAGALLLLAGYGALLPALAPAPAPATAATTASGSSSPTAATALPPSSASNTVRIALIQSNLVDYERRRQQQGSDKAVRQILDTHFAMSYDAVVRQQADAVLWSETSYPTTFGQPKSAAGRALDQAILDIVNSAGVPFVFGTYDLDQNGEYNAAAFVAPGTGLLGFYRKTRLFPFTEYVPGWLDSALLRRHVPWLGNWRAGNGARVFPLKLADGREIQVLPLICRDDVDSSLGIAGARLGAQLILTMSNDSWFTGYPQGAMLHQAAAAFRSIETRLPQFRVTNNGYSAIIDATGHILAAGQIGQQTLVVGNLPVGTPPRTLMVWWGNWVGLLALFGLGLLAAHALAGQLGQTASGQAARVWLTARLIPPIRLPQQVALLPPAARLIAALLQGAAGAGLLWFGYALLQNEVLRTNTLLQGRQFAALFLAPLAASWCVRQAFAARLTLAAGHVVLMRGTHQIKLALSEISALEPWPIALPGPGCHLRLVDGTRWPHALAFSNQGQLSALIAALAQNGIGMHDIDQGADKVLGTRASVYLRARLACRFTRLDLPWIKYLVLPFALAFPAYYLHQHIAYGSGFGEYFAFGAKAYAIGLGLWWSAWVIGVTLCGLLLRVLTEAGTLLTVLLLPACLPDARFWLERGTQVALYLGLPGWLLLRTFGS